MQLQANNFDHFVVGALLAPCRHLQETWWKNGTLFALAVLTVSGASFAQSSVTIGGLIDIAPLSMGKVTTMAKESNTAVGVKTDRTGSPTTWATSVLTVSGTEDLGGGLKANFLLMSGAGAGTGAHTPDSTTNASDSGIGNRERSVGLSGGFGALR